MKLPRIFLVIGVLSLAALFAFACSDDDGDGNGNGNGNGDPTDVIDELLTDFGVTDTEIKLGQTTALSGNPSATGYAAIASGTEAAFAKINAEDGGACGRQINFKFVDDQYDPALSLDQATRLAVQDEVLAFVGNLGTPAVSGHIDFVNDPNGDGDTSDGIPHLYLSTGAAKWDDPEQWPWTIGYIPDYVSEGQVLARTANERFPGQTAAILYQNDDFGEDGRAGVKAVFEGEIVAEQSYDATAADVTSQMANIRDADPDIVFFYSVFLITSNAATYMAQNDWNPQMFWSYVNPPTVVGAVLGGADGPEAGYRRIAGTVAASYLLDPIADADLPAMIEHVRIMETYDGPPVSALTVYGDSLARLVKHTLEVACDNGDMTRAGMLAAAESIQGYVNDLYFPGIEVNLGPDDHFAIESLQPVEVQEDGSLLPLGDLIDVAD